MNDAQRRQLSKEFDEMEVRIYGEEKAALRRRVEVANSEGLKKIAKIIEWKKSSLEQTPLLTFVKNLSEWGQANADVMWDLVEKDMVKFGAIGIADMFPLAPKNREILDRQQKEYDELQYHGMLLSKDLTELSTAALYYISIGDAHVPAELTELEAWLPEGWIDYLNAQEKLNVENSAEDTVPVGDSVAEAL